MTGRHFANTYQLAEGPAPWSWHDYRSWLEHEWPLILETAASDEGQIQRFLEQHPCLLPGHGVDTLGGHHGPFPEAVISQPPLPGLESPVPDFMWLTKDSERLVPVLIEIERPNKAWFRRNGQAREELTQALDQLASWRTWFSQIGNVDTFYVQYHISAEDRRRLPLDPRYVLIYGRRSEIDSLGDEIARKRLALRPAAGDWMTFDRLAASEGMRSAFTIQVRKRQFVAIAIPPTFQLGPRIAGGLLYVSGLEEAIAGNEFINDDRKQFLLDRLPYWRRWAALPSRGIVRSGDAE